MPKIIENVKGQLVAEARRQVMEIGYSAMTVRSVAQACHIATGTVYNYFSSKDMLVATFMLEDWGACLDGVRRRATADPSFKNVLGAVYRGLNTFISEHEKLFCDADAFKAYSAVYGDKHAFFRSQIASVVLLAIRENNEKKRNFLSEFIAEALLTWTLAGKSFDEIYAVLQKLL